MIWDERRYDGNREIHNTKHDTYDHFSSMKGVFVANLIQTEKRIYAIIHAIKETKDSKYHKEEEETSRNINKRCERRETTNYQ